ncbi:MAG: hypothetical protein AB2421_13860 [Thermotaleaceae bacterium]
MNSNIEEKKRHLYLPEITGFLNLSRRYIREIELLQDIDVSKEDAVAIKKAALQVGKITFTYYTDDPGKDVE